MKKVSFLLVLVMLVNLIVLPVSAASLTNLFTTSTLVWSNWATQGANLVDRDTATSSNLGVHGVGAKGTYNFRVSTDGSVKYNKLVVKVDILNTSTFYVKTSNSLDGTIPSSSGKSTVTLADAVTRYTHNLNYVGDKSTSYTYSFDATTDKYLQIMSVVKDAEANGFKASEVYLYYATPASITLDTISDLIVGNGGTINPVATIYDVDNARIKDTTLNGINWSINDDATGVTINQSTGQITVLPSAPVQTVTVTAKSKNKSSLVATTTFKIKNGTLTNLFSSSTLAWSNWANLASNLIDGDTTTTSNLGVHGAGGKGHYTFRVSTDGSVKYNKFKVRIENYNTETLYLKSSNELNGTEPTESGKSTVTLSNETVLREYTPSEPLSTTAETLYFSFPATTDKYFQFMSVVADGTANGFKASEMYLYYATPALVKIDTTYSNFVYGDGGTHSSSARVNDVEGSIIKDTNLNGITWSINSTAEGVSIDAATGKITVEKEAPVQTVTVKATSKYKSTLYATKTFKITAPTMTNLLKSSTVVWSPWSGTMTANAVDGDDTTFYNSGEHSAGSVGRFLINVSDNNSVKYNKAVIDVTRFNSTAFSLSSSDEINGTEPTTNTQSSVNLSSATTLATKTLSTPRTDVATESIKFSFNTTNHKYLRFENTVAVGSPTYGLKINEIKLYYATPAKIDISLSKSRILAGQAQTITGTASVKDSQGDTLNDTTLNGVVWSINSDAEGVTIDSATGKITVLEDAPIQDVTVTAKSSATGYSGITSKKTLKISSTLEPTFSERVKDGTIKNLNFEVSQDNNKVGALLSFTSSSALATPYIVVLALYDSSNKLCALEAKNIDYVNKGNTNTMVSKNMSSAYKSAKIYALDGELAPLSKVKTHTIKTLDSLKIFSIGNSAGEDATRYVWSIANNMGIKNVVVGHMMIGGATLKTHWTNIENKSATYNYQKSTSATVVSNKEIDMLTAIKDENWDIIVIQQSVGGGWEFDAYEPYLTNIINFVEKNAPNKNYKLAWHMTIPYQSDYTGSAFANYNNNQLTMYNTFVRAVKEIVIPKNKFDIIIPNGTVAQNVRSSFIGDTITRDGGHMSYNFGRLMSGMSWVRALTGMSIDHVTFKPSTEVTDAQVDIIKRSINAAQKSPYAITQMVTKNDGITNN